MTVHCEKICKSLLLCMFLLSRKPQVTAFRQGSIIRSPGYSSVLENIVAGYGLHANSAYTSPGSRTTRLFGIKGFRGWFESQFPQAIIDIPKKGSQEDFDHVLVDLNQLLHICVRRSRSDEHALVLLMKELDAVVDLATPRSSLVLAMDGPPSAAKLATQRRRRFSILNKTEFKLKQLEHFQHLTSRIKPQQLTRKRRRIVSEIRTLRISKFGAFV